MSSAEKINCISRFIMRSITEYQNKSKYKELPLMTNTKFHTSILEVVKALVFGIIIPFFIFHTSGLAWMYSYMVIMAMFYNFVIRESTPAAYLLILEGITVVGFYAVLAIILFVGALAAALGV